MKSKLLTVISVFVLTIVSFAEIGIHENRSSLNDHIINPTTKTAYAVKDVGVL